MGASRKPGARNKRTVEVLCCGSIQLVTRQTARQLPEQLTTAWVDPPSTGETRLGRTSKFNGYEARHAFLFRTIRLLDDFQAGLTAGPPRSRPARRGVLSRGG